MQDDVELLDLMMKDQSQQKNVYRPGPYWIDNQIRYLKSIYELGVLNFRSEPRISKAFGTHSTFWPEDKYMSDHRPIPRLKGRVKCFLTKLPIFSKIISDYKHVATVAQERYLKYFTSFHCQNLNVIDVPKNTLTCGVDAIGDFSGVKYATDYLKNALRIENFSHYVDFKKVRSVIEIGGGFGIVPHILSHNFKNIKKVFYIDIPPMIYLATQYLKQFFVVKDYSQTRNLDKILFSKDDDFEIICLCPWQIENISEQVDLLWNTASFSEMTQEIVENYSNHLKKMNLKSICLMLNKTGNDGMTTSRGKILELLGGDFIEISADLKSSRGVFNESPCYVKLTKEMAVI
jgi:putative sugar O-methyltransferase